jgi:hypothetical protein
MRSVQPVSLFADTLSRTAPLCPHATWQIAATSNVVRQRSVRLITMRRSPSAQDSPRTAHSCGLCYKGDNSLPGHNISAPRSTRGRWSQPAFLWSRACAWFGEVFRSNARLCALDPGRRTSVPTATARASAGSAASAAALARLVAIPAKHRPVAAWFKWNCCRLTAAGTDHRRSLCRSRTVAGTSPTLVVLLCHTARLAPLGGRVAAFLKERLISSGEGKVLPAIAAS